MAAASNNPLNSVVVRRFDGDQQYQESILKGGLDATEDVTPASKNHSLWDEDWD